MEVATPTKTLREDESIELKMYCCVLSVVGTGDSFLFILSFMMTQGKQRVNDLYAAQNNMQHNIKPFRELRNHS